MKYIKPTKKKIFLFLVICFMVLTITYLRILFTLPNQITLFENKEYNYNFKSPFLVNLEAENDDILIFESEDSKVSDDKNGSNDNIMIKAKKLGRTTLSLRLFGLIPIKTMQVDVVPYKEVVACGNTVGVKIKVNGILVIGISDVETVDGQRMLPARDSGLKPGDLIVEVNNQKVESAYDLMSQIENSQGQKISIKYKRGNSYNNTKVTPVMAVEDKKYRIGMWVRDSTAGIGTLTFYDPQTKGFGALGHGITDIDTGAIMPVGKGEIIESNILTIKKGTKGNPGELKGILIEDTEPLGIISKNSQYGIYGTLNDKAINIFSRKQYPIALRNDIKTGPAKILANIDGKSVVEYDIEIEKVSKKSANGLKGMIIKVTDQRLLDAIGGIVQGMSGSPILQDGKLIGAVTHVLVNDPTRGYGILIEWMVKNMTDANIQSFERAS
ncbi:MAG TPA: SpoIVB peptidase [Acetivibrio sp.]|nr:SpoIVB peptidase [Acetivibrio sp.]